MEKDTNIIAANFLPTPIEGASAVAFNNSILLVGGRTSINGSDEVDLEALVFSHFIPNQEKEIITCEHCKDEFKITTSAKDLEHHLKTIHDINL